MTSQGNAWESVTLRPLQNDPSDFAQLVRWFQDPHVAAFYPEDPTPEQILKKYGGRMSPKSRIRPRMILYQANPVGYAQFYPLAPEEIACDGLDPGGQWGGFDLLIGETHLWGNGIGYTVVCLLLDELRSLRLTRAAIDTALHNKRALRLYRKAEFETFRILPRPQGGADRLVLTRRLTD